MSGEEQAVTGEEQVITVFVTTTSTNSKINAQQNKIELVLTAKKVKFVKVDTATLDGEAKWEMRRIMENDTGLAPQICNGEIYCGNFESFDEANECGELADFLKLSPCPRQQNVES